MIRFESQPGSRGSRGHRLDALGAARDDLAEILGILESMLESLHEDTLDDLRPQLTDTMRRLLSATRTVAEASRNLPPDVIAEVADAQQLLSNRLLDFRRAMGSRSADTIRHSLRGDLVASATTWNRLLDDVMDHIRSTREDA